MKPLDIMKFIGELGWRYMERDIPRCFDYFSQMIADDRVMLITANAKIFGIVAFSICNDLEPFLFKDEWDFVEHDPEGTVAFIEHMSVERFDFKILEIIEKSLAARYPNMEAGMWKRYRPKKDKIYYMKRRFADV